MDGKFAWQFYPDGLGCLVAALRDVTPFVQTGSLPTIPIGGDILERLPHRLYIVCSCGRERSALRILPRVDDPFTAGSNGRALWQ